MGNSTAFPQKIKNRLRYNPAIPLLGVYPDEKKNKKNTKPKCPSTDERIKN